MTVLLLSIALGVCFIWLSYTDIRYRKIKNQTVLAVAALSALLALQLYQEIFIAASLFILALGMPLSLLNIIGAGDIKLLAALALSLPADNVAMFILFTMLAGVPVLAGMMIFRIFSKNRRQCNTVPYGLAIAIGYVLTII
ncbi:flp operon protein B [Mixta gaviniae]|uniref:Flp operon protein B n=1 Tax=Mixta gaviniae TaxID=665914 RepID=A0A2L0IHM0_9GAMM|nr:flp operon protein B [Mixta gaviniae]